MCPCASFPLESEASWSAAIPCRFRGRRVEQLMELVHAEAASQGESARGLAQSKSWRPFAWGLPVANATYAFRCLHSGLFKQLSQFGGQAIKELIGSSRLRCCLRLDSTARTFHTPAGPSGLSRVPDNAHGVDPKSFHLSIRQSFTKDGSTGPGMREVTELYFGKSELQAY